MTSRPRVACLYFLLERSEAEVAAFAEACFRLTPVIALRGREAVFLDLKGTERLWSDRVLLLRIRALAKRYGLERNLVLNFAHNPSQALALAREQKTDWKELSIRSLRDWLNPFLETGTEWEDRSKRLDRVIRLLEKLGIQKVSEFLLLPEKSLLSRFGRETLQVYQQARWGDARPWKRFFPQEKFLESFDLQQEGVVQGSESWEEFLFPLKALLDRCACRLRARFEKVVRYELRLVMERYQSTQKCEHEHIWKQDFLVPQKSARNMLRLLKDGWSSHFQRHPLEAPVTRLELEILETVPDVLAQRAFFDRDSENQEAWEQLWSRMTGKLGEKQVFFGVEENRHRPENAWKKGVTKEALPRLDATVLEPEEMGLPRRPTRLLRTPELLVWSQGAFYRFEGLPKFWKILEWVGPERLQGEWWHAEQFARDYYRVWTTTQQELWIYKDLESEAFYLQGFFD